MTATAKSQAEVSAVTSDAARRGVLLSMCLALVLVTASMSALNIALPDLALDLSASTTSLTWIVDSYTVALSGFVLPLGALGDRLGRRAVLITGTVVFGAASLAASFSSSTNALVTWRVVMGLGAAMIMPGTLSTITAVFPADRRAKAVAIWSGCAASGVIIGMLVSGALLERFTWKSIFVTSATVALATALGAALLAPETKDAHPGRFDIAGAVCTALAPGALVYALIDGNDRGWTQPWVLGALAVTVVACTAYVILGLRTEHPLLDPRLFGIRGFRAGTVTLLVQFMAIFGFYFVGLQYLQLALGYSPLKSAVALVPIGLIVVPTSQLTPYLVHRIGMRVVMVSGLLLLGAGLTAMSLLHTESGYLPFLGSLALAGFGIGLTGAVGTSAITGSLTRNQQGVASAVNDATREVGAAIGIALMGSVFGSHYRSSLPDGVTRLPAAAGDAVRRSPAAGLYVADHIGPQGAILAKGVKDAFMDGMSAALGTVAVVVTVAACYLLSAPKKPPKLD